MNQTVVHEVPSYYYALVSNPELPIERKIPLLSEMGFDTNKLCFYRWMIKNGSHPENTFGHTSTAIPSFDVSELLGVPVS